MNEDLPAITIAMPVKNRAWVLLYTLRSVEQQDYPKELIKIVFVDNYSDDGTYEILSEWTKRNSPYYREIVLVREQGNLSHLRNICLSYTSTPFIVFWDSDIIAPSNALRTLINVIKSHRDVAAVTVEYVLGDLDRISAILSTSQHDIKIKEVSGVGLGLTVFRTDLLGDIGGFDEHITVGEDTYISYKVCEKTKTKFLRLSIKVLHTKHRDQILPRATQSLRRWLGFVFHRRSKEYILSWRNLPLHLKLRVLYWMAFPIIVLIPLFAYLTSITMEIRALMLITTLLYIVISIYHYVINGGLKDGLKMWFTFALPTGIALSYGIFKEVIVSALKRR